MTSIQALGIASAFLVAIAWSRPAAAQQPPLPDPPEGQETEALAADASPEDRERQRLEQAREHMDEGVRLYDQERYIEASEEFQRAYEIQPFGAFLFNAGVAYERHGNYARAADFFARYLEREPGSADAAEVSRRIDSLRTRALNAGQAGGAGEGGEGAGNDSGEAGESGEAAETRPTVDVDALPDAVAPGVAPTMKSLLSVRTNPAGAEVVIRQGEEHLATGPGPFLFSVEEGDYQLEVNHPDYQTVETPVRVTAGKVYIVIVEMSQGEVFGHLRVVSDVQGARVFLDNREDGAVGRTPFIATVPTGEHQVWVERGGYEPIQEMVTVLAGDETDLRLTLQRVPYGRVEVSSRIEGTRVFIDDEEVGLVPFSGQVDPGQRLVRLEADGMKTWEGEVLVSRGQLTPIRGILRPSVGRGGAWVTAVLSAATLGGGIALGVLSNNLANELEADRDAGQLVSDDPRLLEGTILAISADVAFGLSAILGVVSLINFLRDPLPDSDATVLEPRDWELEVALTPTGLVGVF